MPENSPATRTPSLASPRRCYEVIAAALLKRGYTARITEKVLGANFARVFAETWTAGPKTCA